MGDEGRQINDDDRHDHDRYEHDPSDPDPSRPWRLYRLCCESDKIQIRNNWNGEKNKQWNKSTFIKVTRSSEGQLKLTFAIAI